MPVSVSAEYLDRQRRKNISVINNDGVAIPEQIHGNEENYTSFNKSQPFAQSLVKLAIDLIKQKAVVPDVGEVASSGMVEKFRKKYTKNVQNNIGAEQHR